MTKPLLIEIAVEELPAIPFLKELPNIKAKWGKILKTNNLFCKFDFYYTPRRFVLWHREFKTKQDDKDIELFGAPENIAIKNGEKTNAFFAFLKKCNCGEDDISFVQQGNNKILYYKSNIKGIASKDILSDMINEFLSQLNFGKSMRWSDRKDSFIRPIRGLSIILGDELIDGEIFGIKSTKTSFGHRMIGYEPFGFEFAGDYFCKLDKNGVMLYQDERKKTILEQIKKLEKKYNLTVEIDINLLDEIVAITEYPTALLGSFDEEFLNLPKEVIIYSMKEHQRYFACFQNGVITNKFIVVSNSKTDDFSHIIAGNEKVLRPRLADAMFFYKNDLANKLNNEGLKKVTFIDKLGSIYDKCQREVKIALKLTQAFDMENQNALIEKTIMLSKADLLSDMVGEFGNLQGLMGYYYAKNANENKLLYTAIKEQYLPTTQQGELPSNSFSSVVAISNKLDNLMALFSINMTPTSSKDPYALRRSAFGIIKISIKHKLNLDIKDIVDNTNSIYNNFDTKQLLAFFEERFYQLFSDINPTVIKAVLKSGETNILKINDKIKALNPIVASGDFKSYSTTFKRVANIIKDIDINSTLNIDEKLLYEDAEKTLYQKFDNISKIKYKTYEEKLNNLFSLKQYLDDFFDNVFVNCEDKALQTNRKNIVGKIYQAFKDIADIKEITI